LLLQVFLSRHGLSHGHLLSKSPDDTAPTCKWESYDPFALHDRLRWMNSPGSEKRMRHEKRKPSHDLLIGGLKPTAAPTTVFLGVNVDGPRRSLGRNWRHARQIFFEIVKQYSRVAPSFNCTQPPVAYILVKH
jgi:hypothetical protein